MNNLRLASMLVTGLASTLLLSACVTEPSDPIQSSNVRSPSIVVPSATPTADSIAEVQNTLMTELLKYRVGDEVPARFYRKLDLTKTAKPSTGPWIYRTVDGAYIRADRWAKPEMPGNSGIFAPLPKRVTADLQTRASILPAADADGINTSAEALAQLWDQFAEDEGSWTPGHNAQYDSHTLVVVTRALSDEGSVMWQHRVLRTDGDGSEPLKSRDDFVSDADSKSEVVADAKDMIATYAKAEEQPDRYVLVGGE